VVREFKLMNEKGQEYSLMDIHNYCLLTDPTGLGYGYSTEYEQVGNTFIEKFRQLEQGKISGKANFINYDNYKKLIDFIQKSQKLKVVYVIPYETGSKEYYKDVQIQNLSKTQKNINGIISETLILNCLSLWYEERTVTYTIEPLSDEIRWDFRWDSSFTDYNSRSLQYINDGHVEAPIEIEISGHVVNPRLELYIEGQLYQTVTFNVEINAYEKLLYGTKENEFYILKQHTDGTTESLFNLDVINFENDNVIRIPTNKSCELKIEADNEVLNAQITIYPQYIAV